MPDIHTLILAEDPLARAGLAAMLQQESGIRVVGQASPANDMLDAFSQHVTLIDLGWEAQADLSDLAETTLFAVGGPVLVLLPDDDLTAQALAQLSTANLPGYGVLSRNTPAKLVVAALHALDAGLIVIDPSISTSALSATPDPTLPPLVEDLTPREKEVLDLLAEGLANKTIARQLTISEYTVKFHVNSILTKLNAASRTEAVVRATRLGLITL